MITVMIMIMVVMTKMIIWHRPMSQGEDDNDDNVGVNGDNVDAANDYDDNDNYENDNDEDGNVAVNDLSLSDVTGGCR